MSLPSVIMFVNNDLADQVRTHIVKQLQISETMDGYTFDSRVTANSTYPDEVKANRLRIMVERPFSDLTNRELADIAIFVYGAIGSIEASKYGPPGQSFSLLNFNWAALGLY